MKYKTLFFFLTACVLFISHANVLASGGSGGAVATPRPDVADNFIPTRSVRGELLKITESSVTVRDGKGIETTVALDSKTKFKAEDKAAFSGKGKLEARDLSAGISVRILYREGDKTAVEIKALKKKQQ